jgi:hypothetical protein
MEVKNKARLFGLAFFHVGYSSQLGLELSRDYFNNAFFLKKYKSNAVTSTERAFTEMSHKMSFSINSLKIDEALIFEPCLFLFHSLTASFAAFDSPTRI